MNRRLLLGIPLLAGCGGAMIGVPKQIENGDPICKADVVQVAESEFMSEALKRGETLSPGTVRGYADHAASLLCGSDPSVRVDPSVVRRKVDEFVGVANGECSKSSVSGCWSTDAGLKAGAASLCPGFWPFC